MNAWGRSAVWALLVAVGCCACTGTETGNPGPGAQPEVSLISVPPVSPPISSGPAVLQIRVAVGSFIAVSCDGQTTNLTDPFQALLDSPDATDVSVQEVSACELSLGLEPQMLGEPGEAELASVLVQGTLGDDTPIVISSDAPLSVTLMPTAPPVVLDAESRWLLAFDVGVMLAGLDLGGVQPGPDGIRIDGLTHPELLATFEANFPASVSLYRDLDGDGERDPEDVAVAVPE